MKEHEKLEAFGMQCIAKRDVITSSPPLSPPSPDASSWTSFPNVTCQTKFDEPNTRLLMRNKKPLMRLIVHSELSSDGARPSVSKSERLVARDDNSPQSKVNMMLQLLPRRTVWCVAPPRTEMIGRERELEGRACGLADRVHVFV